MNNLRNNGTLDSREVAKMIDKSHKNLLADIRIYEKYMEESTELIIQPSDFFIKSVYQDSTGRTQPCYLITRKGCEMVANKLTGAKGVQFTARYIQRFHEMEQAGQAALPCAPDKLLRAQASLINAQTRQFEAIMHAVDAANSIGPAARLLLRLRVVEAIFDIDMSYMMPCACGNYRDEFASAMKWGS